MKEIIGIIDYGVAGNVRSITKALDHIGAITVIVDSPSQLESVDRIVLPGVGSFPDGMRELKSKQLFVPLIQNINSKPTLGICLGMQILAKIGFEYGKTEGLGLIDAEVKPIICDGPIPHMGFNTIDLISNDPLFKGIENAEFYFMHSYELVNYRNAIALSSYRDHEFVSAVSKDNIYGVQFHPEKSREAGLELFKNFINV